MKNKKVIIDFNRTLYDPESGLVIDGALELLKYLYTFADLYLVSRNEKERWQKFQDLGLEEYFKKIYFVEEKTQSLFEEIISETSKDHCYVIGDRIQEEIVIGNILGINTIWFKSGKFREYTPYHQNEFPKSTVERLIEIKEIIL